MPGDSTARCRSCAPKKTLNAMSAGEVLKIIATDPGSVKDFEAFATQTGNELMGSSEDNGEFHFLLKKGG